MDKYEQAKDIINGLDLLLAERTSTRTEHLQIINSINFLKTCIEELEAAETELSKQLVEDEAH